MAHRRSDGQGRYVPPGPGSLDNAAAATRASITSSTSPLDRKYAVCWSCPPFYIELRIYLRAPI